MIAAICYGTQYVPQKLAGKVKTEYYNLTMIIGIVIATSITYFIGSCIFDFEIISLTPFLLSFAGGFFWAFANRLSLVGINNIGMAKTTVILNFVSIISFIFGIIFLSESPTFFLYIGIPFLIGGSIIVSLLSENNKQINKKGVFAVFLATFFISILNVLITDAIIAQYFPHPTILFFTATMCMSFGSLLGAIIFNLRISKLREWFAQPKKTHLYALGAGLIWMVGFEITSYILAEFGLSFGVPIIQSVMILVSALWGILYFKEIVGRKKLGYYCIGAGITIVGVILFAI